MISEQKVIEKIIELESLHDPDDEYSYLDEYQQGQLQSLYEVLDRELTDQENEQLIENRKEMLDL